MNADRRPLFRVTRLLLVVSSVAALPAVAQSSTSVLTGTVVDAQTKQPAADVVVTASSPNLQGEQIVVTDATGNDRSMSNALGYVAQTGTLVYVGITSAEITIPHPALHKPEMTIKGSRNALPADFTRIIHLIEDGTIDTNPWITHRTSFDAVIDEFESFTRPETGVVKAVIEVT